MTHTSVINHGNARFFHLRQEYLDICQDHDYTPGKPVRSAVECAAKLLDILEFWANYRVNQLNIILRKNKS